jgi:hypothetical protein
MARPGLARLGACVEKTEKLAKQKLGWQIFWIETRSTGMLSLQASALSCSARSRVRFAVGAWVAQSRWRRVNGARNAEDSKNDFGTARSG